jgi:hypothetical protein
MTEHQKSVVVWPGAPAHAVLWLWALVALPACPVRGVLTAPDFVIVDSAFHVRDPTDAGEVRICLQNTGAASLSWAQLRVRVWAGKPDDANAPGPEQKCVYFRLSPPVLVSGQQGLLVAKLFERPAQGQTLTCTVFAGTAAHTTAVTAPALWITYVGFSQDLRRVFVYVENASDTVVCTEALQVGEKEDQIEGPVGIMHRRMPPHERGCLIGRLATALTPGQFTHVTVSARRSDQEFRVHTVVRAINRMPLLLVESGAPDPGLGLDLQGFTETMACIAHAHGTPAQAAGKFLEDYARRCQQDPHEVIQVDICRSDSPRSWFRFASLADVVRMNPVLPPAWDGDQEDPQQWFSPFLHRGHLARKAVEPCRYLAVIPLVPEGELFLQKELTPSEIKFLVHCALASGAKGLAYRGTLPEEPLSRSAFLRLNTELRQIEPLLLLGEPVNWATTNNDDYAVSSLWCGDQAVLVMVFDRRYFSQQKNNRFYTPRFGKAVVPVKITLRVPPESSVKQLRTLSTLLPCGSWSCRAGSLDFTADMMDCVQLYLVDLQWQIGTPGG